MNVDMNFTAEITGQGMTMEALAQAWDALNDRDVPPDAAIRVSHYNGGHWMVKATWSPADPAPDEEEADAADQIPLEGRWRQSNLDAIREQIRGGLIGGGIPAPTPRPEDVGWAVKPRPRRRPTILSVHDESVCSGGRIICHECLAAGDPGQ